MNKENKLTRDLPGNLVQYTTIAQLKNKITDNTVLGLFPLDISANIFLSLQNKN